MAEGFEQTFLQKDIQMGNEQIMLNVISYQRNANQTAMRYCSTFTRMIVT